MISLIITLSVLGILFTPFWIWCVRMWWFLCVWAWEATDREATDL